MSKKRIVQLILVGLVIWAIGWFIFLLPNPLFSTPYSTVVNDYHHQLLNARISKDGQWRFPISDSIPEKFRKCIIEFEDRNFQHHIGIDFGAIIRAIKQNYEAGEIVSGGSTISMQLARLIEQNQPRTYLQKLKEIGMALRLELGYSKEEILNYYCAQAPFGGNVVGLEAASWRYFGRSAHTLSWAESATLAVLPNAPSLIHLSKNRNALKNKRNRLLKRLFDSGAMEETTYNLSLLEELPAAPKSLPQKAQHLSNYLVKHHGSGHRFSTYLRKELQVKVTDIANRYGKGIAQKGYHNLGIIVLDNATMSPMVYVGNCAAGNDNEGYVDNIQAPRSTGSILKPLLYERNVSRGEYLPREILGDYPVRFGHYSPENYNKTFDGAVSADEAMARSLNIPAVLSLQKYGIGVFLDDLREMGFTTFNQSADYYGLSLILGGGEVTLFELAQTYANAAQQLQHFPQPYSWQKINVLSNSTKEEFATTMTAGGIYHMVQAMQKVKKPEHLWYKTVVNDHSVAWKTGTSFGFRDAWSVSISPFYTIAVWVGNSDGEGKVGLTGLEAAAPLMFEVIETLPDYGLVFNPPFDEMDSVQVCAHSGQKAGPNCAEVNKELLHKTASKTLKCKYCKNIWVNPNNGLRVTKNCFDDPLAVKRFHLPNRMEWFYRKKNANYTPLPVWQEGCTPSENNRSSLSFIYPQHNDILVLGKNADGVILKAVNASNSSKIFWYDNDTYLGETSDFNEWSLKAKKGRHLLTIMNELGDRKSIVIQIE